MFQAGKHDLVVKAVDDAEKSAAYAAALQESEDSVDRAPLPKHFSQEELDALLVLHQANASAEISNTLTLANLRQFIDPAQITRLAIKALIKFYLHFLGKTGIVVVGYGDHEYFPCANEYSCYGFLAKKFIFDEVIGPH